MAPLCSRHGQLLTVQLFSITRLLCLSVLFSASFDRSHSRYMVSSTCAHSRREMILSRLPAAAPAMARRTAAVPHQGAQHHARDASSQPPPPPPPTCAPPQKLGGRARAMCVCARARRARAALPDGAESTVQATVDCCGASA